MKLKEIRNKNPREKTYLCFGELMLRLSPPGFERLLQSSVLHASFGGGEANVAVSLALHGLKSRFVTALPDNDIGRAALRCLRGFGVDTSPVKMVKGGRMGIYFMEKGANQRPSSVIYDRDRAAVNGLDGVDWPALLADCGWFHVTGITPALSENAAAQSLRAVKAAREAGAVVSCDLNYRAKLWNYGTAARDFMPRLAESADVLIANEEDCQKSLGIETRADVSSGSLPDEAYRELSGRVLETFPSLGAVAITLRESLSAGHNRWSACINDGTAFYRTERFDITHIVDRVGAGDSFAAALIYGLSVFPAPAEALNYAVAASCLKHSIEGDFNLSSPEDIMRLSRGDGSGRISR